MMRIAFLIASLLFAGVFDTTLFAQQQSQSAQRANRVGGDDARKAADSLRRDWLRKQLPKVYSDPVELTAKLKQVEQLSEDEVNEWSNEILEQLEEGRQSKLSSLRESNAQERARQSQMQQANRAAAGQAGFFPIVTTYPAGVSLSSYVIASPDGRYIRMSLIPVFSAFGPIYAFDWYPGYYPSWDPFVAVPVYPIYPVPPVYGYYPPYFYGHQHHHGVHHGHHHHGHHHGHGHQHGPPRRSYYDGLRTRNDWRPAR